MLPLFFGCSTLSGCLDNKLPESAGDGGPAVSAETYLPVQSDFYKFRDWQSYELRSMNDVKTGKSIATVVYISPVPEAGQKEFAVGTKIVKAIQAGPPAQWTVMAMAKRGGSFNPKGALGWEYFDFSIVDNDQLVMHWRGEHVPAGGENYQTLPGEPVNTIPEDQCNNCHASTKKQTNGFFPNKNDHVISKPLQLTGF